jgi:acetyl/propionyl-CoA carboxylase alpha subunit
MTKADMEAQYKSAKEETVRITGNDIVFIEALVVKGRHLEVQALADMHSNVNTFGVRDCSVQRKNQKIIEETPPPNFEASVIEEMQASAARLIKAASYVGAGTVEYLYDLVRKQFFFMEVNTRLQVEHPITETLYGIDLVKGQIAVALGEEVDLSHRKPDGWVMEVRLNAEDAEKEFTPAPGFVELFKAPAGPGIRVDSGIEQGSEIPSDFDSMVAKIIASGPTRKEAMSRLKRALQELRIKIENGTTNRSFLLELLDNEDIIAGGVHTGFVGELIANRKKQPEKAKTELALLAGAIELYNQMLNADFTNFREQINRSGRPRNILSSSGYEVSLSTGGNSYTFQVKSIGNNHYIVQHEDASIDVEYTVQDQEAVITKDGNSSNILMIPRGGMLQCEVDGYPVMLERESGGYLRSPSPAMVLSVNVEENQAVKKGDVLLVLEAMKMEMVLDAPQDGTVKELCVTAGSQVAGGQPLIQLELGEAEEEEQPSEEPIVFTHAETTVESQWYQLQSRFLSLFLGFDGRAKIDQLKAFIQSHSEYSEKLISLCINALQKFCQIEQLFLPKETQTESFARPVSYQELLSHFFRRAEDKKKGLPEDFTALLDEIVSGYSKLSPDEDENINLCLFHAFRSHTNLSEKQNLVKQMFFVLEEMQVDESWHAELLKIIQAITNLTQNSAPAVADAAIHAQYKVVDIHRLTKIKAKNEKQLEELVSKVAESQNVEENITALIEAGPSIICDLVALGLTGAPALKSLALRIISERMSRDRIIVSSSQVEAHGAQMHWIESKYRDLSKKTLFILLPKLQKSLNLNSYLEKVPADASTEVVVLTQTDKSIEDDFKTLKIEKFDADWLTIGIFGENKSYSYQSYDKNGDEIDLRRGFSPIQFRELRVLRLRNFNVKQLYANEGVFLLEATAKDNPKDIRLIGYADVSEIEAVLKQ